MATMATLSPARPAKSSTAAQQSKDETAAIPAARFGQTASKFTDRSEKPANLVLAPNSESRSTLTVQARVEPDHIQSAHAPDTVRAPESTLTATGSPSPTRAADGQIVTAIATPTKSTGTQSTVQIPAHHVEGALPQPAPAPEVPHYRQVITHENPNAPSSTSIAQVAVGLPQAPSPVLMPAPMREQISAQSSPINATPHLPVQPGSTALHAQATATDNSPRFSTKAHEATTPAAPIPGHATALAPVQIRTPAFHERSGAADDSPHGSTTAHEATALTPKTGHAPAFAPVQIGTPALHRHSSAADDSPHVSTTDHEATALAPKPGHSPAFAPVQIGSPALYEQSGAADDSPRLSTTAHEATALAPKTGHTTPFAPIQTGTPALHRPSVAAHDSPHASTTAHEATALAGQATAFAQVQTGTPALHEQSVAAHDSPHVSTTAHEATAVAPKTGHTTAFAPIQTGIPAVHGKSSASENTTRSPAPLSPVIPPAGIPTFSVTPTSVGKSVALSTQPEHTAHDPGLASIANLLQPHTVEKAFDATPAPRQASAWVHPLAAKPTIQAPADKEGDTSRDAAVVVGAPQAQQLPYAMPAAAPPTTAPTRSPKVPASLAPNMPVHDQKENTPVQSHARSGHRTVADAPPTQALKPDKRPDSIPPPVVAQAPSPSIPLPIPATVEQESVAPPFARNPQPVSPAETAHPMAAGKASARVAARPVADHPTVIDNAKPAESTAQLKTPEPNPKHAVTSSQNSTPATANKPASTSPDPAATLPAPASAHAGNKSALHPEPLAGKQRMHIEDKKEADETTQAPAVSPPGTLRPAQASHASPSAPIEVTVAKAEASQTPEHKNAEVASSQNTSAQSIASQPLAAKEAPHPIVLSTVENPTGFVPPSTLLSTHGEGGAREASAPSPVAVETAGLVDRAVRDPGLSVTVMPHSAHLSIAGDTGDLSLHVRVRDGSADVNVSGTMAPLFDTKAPEMRTVLASEGLQLGSFATDQRGSSQGQQGTPENTPRTNVPQSLPPPHRTNTSSPEVQIADDQRIHVTA
jgi:hypothetical protein